DEFMKVGIILFSNKRFSPFLKYYTNILSHQQGVSYQLIFLNRDVSLRETTTDNETSISWIGKGTNKAGTPEKFLNFIHFAIRAGHIIKSKHFDYLIILTTMPAVLLSHLLIRQYSGRYLIDIRDYTHEGFKPYFHIEEQVLHHSD
ncbi:hypothetical protein, partial [Ligilactobacillus salivarius]|uniref:hypothetical protein n=1 Tax=Ligilactobacillus salivarius TaxID=1624 RepID=UPI00136ED7D9